MLGFILLLGTILRLYNLGAESYWSDEIATMLEAQQSIPDLLTTGRLDQPPAYYLLIHFWIRFFGTAEVSLRSLSALAGIGSIILIYEVGKKLFGKEIGLLGAFFLTISDFQIYYAQEARNYSLFEFSALLSFLLFIIALRNKKRIHFFIYAAVSVFMVYTNAYGVCVLAAQNLFFVFQSKKYRSEILIWFTCQALILVSIIPYYSPLIFGGSNVENVILSNVTGEPPATVSFLLRSVYRFILPPRRYFGLEMEVGNSLLAVYAIGGVFFVAGTYIHAIRQGKDNWVVALQGVVDDLPKIPEMNSNLFMVGLWFLCPILIPFVISMIISPIYSHKYVISAAPAFYLLLALGIYGVRRAVPLQISLGVLLILAVPGLSYYYAADVKDQWREAAAYVEENAGPDDVIVIAPNYGVGIQQEAFNFYYQGTLPSCGLGPDELTDVEVWKDLERCVSGHDRFWAIVRYTPDLPYSRFRSFFLNPNQSTMRLIDEQRFYQISVYLFELTE